MGQRAAARRERRGSFVLVFARLPERPAERSQRQHHADEKRTERPGSHPFRPPAERFRRPPPSGHSTALELSQALACLLEPAAGRLLREVLAQDRARALALARQRERRRQVQMDRLRQLELLRACVVDHPTVVVGRLEVAARGEIELRAQDTREAVLVGERDTPRPR
jgi:hypothetical protein